MSNSLGPWFHRPRRSRWRQAALRRRLRSRPQLELLEDRITPSSGSVTIDVTSTADILNPSPGTVTLRSAIQTANSDFANGTATSVKIDLTTPGTYSITLPGTPGEDDNAAGEFAIFAGATSSLSGLHLIIENIGPGIVTIDGNSLARVFDVNPGNVSPTTAGAKLGTVTLCDLDIENGLATSSATVSGAGGAVLNQGPVDLNLIEDVINGNRASSAGGAVANTGGGTVSFVHDTVYSNVSAGIGGGFADVNNAGTLSISDSAFHDNVAASFGGAIVEGGPSTSIFDSEIDGNTAAGTGGAVWLGANPTGTAAASNSTVTIGSSTFDHNTSASDGGAIQLVTTDSAGTFTTAVTIQNATLADNSALNSSAVNGGGINVASGFAGSVTLLDDTITNNFATTGGGVNFAGTDGGTVTVQNTILANNTAATGPDANVASGAAVTFTDSGGNLVGNTSGATGLTSVVAGPFTGLLSVLANNGDNNAGAENGMVGSPVDLTPLLTMVPLPGSAAIANGVTNGITVDERGFSRGTGKPDVGAVQFQNVSLTMSITSASSTVTVGGTATFTITVTNNSGIALPANNSTLTVTLPTGLTATSATTFTLGALAAGASQTVTVTATPTTTGSLTVTATLQSVDATTSPITASVTVTGDSTPPGPPTPVGALTFFAWGFGPGFVLDVFEVDTVGHIFAVPFSSTTATPTFIADDAVFTNLSLMNGAVIANLISSSNQALLVDVFNPSAAFILNALLASIGL